MMLLCKCAPTKQTKKQALPILNIWFMAYRENDIFVVYTLGAVSFPNHLLSLQKCSIAESYLVYPSFLLIFYFNRRFRSKWIQFNTLFKSTGKFLIILYLHKLKNSLNVFNGWIEEKKTTKNASEEENNDLILHLIPFVFLPWIIFFIFQ